MAILARTSLKNRIETNGYVVVPNVLNQEEIQKLRHSLQKYFSSKGYFFALGLIQWNAFAHIKDIDWLPCHQKINEVLRDVLGQDTILLMGHCDAHHNIFRDWHKDYAGGKFFPGDYYDSKECPVYKVGIYLQDHWEQDGLSVRKGSHRSASTTVGDIEHCSTKAGDLVIFDVRLTHRGQPSPALLNFLYTSWIKIPLLRQRKRWFYQLRVIFNRIIRYENRAAVFFTVGIPNSFAEKFAIAMTDMDKTK